MLDTSSRMYQGQDHLKVKVKVKNQCFIVIYGWVGVGDLRPWSLYGSIKLFGKMVCKLEKLYRDANIRVSVLSHLKVVFKNYQCTARFCYLVLEIINTRTCRMSLELRNHHSMPQINFQLWYQICIMLTRASLK